VFLLRLVCLFVGLFVGFSMIAERRITFLEILGRSWSFVKKQSITFEDDPRIPISDFRHV